MHFVPAISFLHKMLKANIGGVWIWWKINCQIQKIEINWLKLHVFLKFYSYNCKIAVAFFSDTILEEGTNLLLSSDVTMTRYGDNCRVKCVLRWHQIAWIYVPWKKKIPACLGWNWKESEFTHKRFLPFIGKWKIRYLWYPLMPSLCST